MRFKPGDRVSFLDEKGTGVITNLIGNFRALVMNEDGFEVSYPVDKLVPLSSKSEYKSNDAMHRKLKGEEDEKLSPPKLSGDEAWEVDLHLHEETDSRKFLSDHEKLIFQLNYFHRCMDAALQHRVRKIIFIHGVGKGTLKKEIIYALREYERVKHYDAPYKKYGFGAMVVELY